jgi:predicted PurR-regulated permease PerM
VGALVLIVGLFGALAATAFAISGPASGWIQKAPEVLPALKEKLVPLRQPIDYMQNAFKELEEVATPTAHDSSSPAVEIKQQSAVAGKLAAGTVAILARLFTTMVILFFLLAAGDVANFVLAMSLEKRCRPNARIVDTSH